jgi:hypothetical protein
MTEHFAKWVPIDGVENEMWVEALHDDYEGLRILLRGTSPSTGVLRICFRSYYLYRNADESYRDKLWLEAAFEQRDWPLCITFESRLIDWLYEECGGVYSKAEMIHYLIKTGADVIEVVTNKTPPTVEWLTGSDDADRSNVDLVKRGKRGSYYNKK